MSVFVDFVSNFFRSASVPECLMYNILLVALELLPVEVVVLPVLKVPEVMDDETMSGGVSFDL